MAVLLRKFCSYPLWLSLSLAGSPGLANADSIRLQQAITGDVAVLKAAEPQLVLTGLAAAPAGPELSLLNSRSLQVTASYALPAGVYQGFAVASLALPSGQPPQQEVVLLGKDGLYRLNAGQPQLLLPCQHIYQHIDENSFKLLPLVFDWNADGLSDFLLPGLSQHCLAIQQSNGQFIASALHYSLPFQITPQEFDQRQLQFDLPIDIRHFDVNGDQRADIVLAGSHGIVYFQQQADGHYHSTATALTLPVPLLASEKRLTQANPQTRYQFHRFEDLNNDGLPDVLVRQKQSGKDQADTQHGIRVFYGQRGEQQQYGFASTQGFIAYPAELVDIGFADFNGDKLQDAYVLGGELGAGSVMSVMLGGGVEMEIMIYPQQQAGTFAKKPVVRYQTEFTVDIHNISYGVLVDAGHFTADSYADLLYVNQKNQLQLRLGTADGWLTTTLKQPDRRLPADPQLLTVLDSDLDGINELLIRRPLATGGYELELVRFQEKSSHRP